ncbi:MAG TPA: glycogen debranching enzyme N-terminal domain-containing protein, partial [Candidatus Binatia bacterium]|nr:glycogen debranching enzyme N-terminal domain-containing protein [Candidatus Binatia bacterium]
MSDLEKFRRDEWLEADGLGGFASGTVSGIRTRRYHALLLAATNPPAGRVVLVNGFDASVETTAGIYALSSQLYSPDVVHPDGEKRISKFTCDPWPQWIYSLEDGTKIQQEIFSVKGSPLVALSWRLLTTGAKAILSVRPFLSGRDYHSMHHENSAFQFQPQMNNRRMVWHPYSGIPGIIALHNGEY